MLKFPFIGQRTWWEVEKMLVTSIYPFSNKVFKRHRNMILYHTETTFDAPNEGSVKLSLCGTGSYFNDAILKLIHQMKMPHSFKMHSF